MSKSLDLIANTKKRDMTIGRPEYKTMLKLINNKAALLDDKNLVDTLYAIGKIHKTERDLVNLPKILNKYLKEVVDRSKYFNEHHIAFLSKGLRNLKWMDIPIEVEIRQALKKRVIEIASQMHVYSISKFMSYLLMMNDVDLQVINVLQDRLITLINEGRVDELELWDFKDILQTFSMLSNEKDHFINRICDIDKFKKEDEVSILTENELKSSMILDLLAPYIVFKVTKLEEVSLPFKINDLCEIIYAYSIARKYNQKEVFELLSNKVADLVVLNENYKFSDTSKVLWAITRFYTNKQFPNYNADISSMIHPRYQYAQIKSTKHRNIDKIFMKICKSNENIEAEYLPMTLYSMASVGYSDKEFFDASILTLIPFTHKKLEPKDIGYLMQAMAMNGLTEYNGFFIDNFDSIFPQFLKAIELKQELAIAQILCSLVQLNIDEAKIHNHEYFIGNIINMLCSEITSDHAFILAPLLWGLTCLGFYDEELFKICMKTLNINNITKFDAILLNQVFNELRQTDKLNLRDHYDLQQICKEQSLRYEDELSKMRLKLISMYKGKDIFDQAEYAHSIVGNTQLKTNTVFDAVQSPLCLVPPCEIGRISVFEKIFIKKIYVKNYSIELYVN